MQTRIPSTTTLRTDVTPDSVGNVIHGTSHRLSECRAFEAMSLEARKNFWRDNDLCFKCCDLLKISSKQEYIMNSCNGKTVTSSRRASGFVLESCDRHIPLDLSFVIECDIIPNNRFDANFRRDPLKRNHFLDFIQKLYNNKHVEIAPLIERDEEVWYLHFFDVYNPRKPDQIRGVSDSSATFCGLSLNDVLMSGSDLNNSLPGVHSRFRKERIALTADIKQIFIVFMCDRITETILDFTGTVTLI